MAIDPSRTVAELVLERPARARALEALRLDYCCGGKRSLEEACQRRGVDLERALEALDAASADPTPEPDWTAVPLAELADHIVSVHHERLRQELPRLDGLLTRVVRAHGAKDPSLAELHGVFGELRRELEGHIVDEEEHLFPAMRAGGPFEAGDQSLLRRGLLHRADPNDRIKLVYHLPPPYIGFRP